MSLRWARHPGWLLVDALAAWRLAHLWTVEDLRPVRAWRDEAQLRLQASHSARLRRIGGHRTVSIPERVSPHPLMPLTDCTVCAGFWTAVAVTVLASTPGVRRVWRPLAVVLAVSTLPLIPAALARKE